MTTADPLQAVELTHHGRLYGQLGLTVQERAIQDPPPEIGRIFVEDLMDQSAILGLSTDATLDQIIAAYKKDIDALTSRHKEADAFLQNMLRSAMKESDHSHHEAKLEIFGKLLEPLGISPQISLTADRCATETYDLVKWLKEEFRSEINRIARRVAAALDLLALHHVVGIVEWKKPDVCKFHYFTWSATHEEVKTETVSGDLKGWNTLTSTVTTTSSLWRTRHTHHVVNTGIHLVKDYKRRIPNRVKSFINSAPTWLKLHLLIIDGTETLTEEVTALGNKTMSQKSRSVARYDPAVALGNFVFCGWNESEFVADAADRRAMIIGFVILGAIIGGLALFVLSLLI